MLITVQRLDLFPVNGDRTGVFGLDQQLAAIEHGDGAAQLVTVLQPDGVGKQGRGRTENSKAQQGSGQHKQIEGSSLRKKVGIIRRNKTLTRTDRTISDEFISQLRDHRLL
ncbi:hypothetical protein D3C78_1718660 [compost metagenome]